MPLDETLALANELPRPEQYSALVTHLNPDWIEEALVATGTATVRKRRLPAAQVVWLVIGMALFRDRSITGVAERLDLAMPCAAHGPTAARSAISQARTRLGSEPLQWLFSRSAKTWGHASAGRDRWHGLALYGVDGTSFRVPDSDENHEHFGVAKGARGESAFPIVRLAALMALRSHLIVDAAFGPYRKGEHSYAEPLWDSIPEHSLTIVDKGFLSAPVLIPLHSEEQERHWLVPAKENSKWKTLERFAGNDERVELELTSHARKKNPALPKTWTARAIRYHRKGFRPRTLLTSLLDPERYPAKDIVSVYHERWEIELGYRELKTQMLDATHRPLRSLIPKRIEQEL